VSHKADFHFLSCQSVDS